MKDAMKKANGLFDAYNRHDSVMRSDQFVESIALALTEAEERGELMGYARGRVGVARQVTEAVAKENKRCLAVAHSCPDAVWGPWVAKRISSTYTEPKKEPVERRCTYPFTACNSANNHGRGCPMEKSTKPRGRK